MSNSIVQQKLLQFLRTKNIYANRIAAQQALMSLTPAVFGDKDCDGAPILARYKDDEGQIKTVIGVCYYENGKFSVTVYDDGSDYYEELAEMLNQVIDSVGLEVVDDVITYVADPNCELIANANTVKEAIDILGNTLEDLEYKIEEIEPESGETEVYKKYQLIDNEGFGHGTISIPKDKFLEKAELVQRYQKDGEWIEEPALELTFIIADGSTEVVDIPIKDLIDTTDIASDKELKAVEDAIGGEYDAENNVFNLDMDGQVIGDATTVVEALEALDLKMSEQSGITPISVDTSGGTISLNYNDCELAGLQVNEEKLDVSFDFGTFEYDIVVAESADDIDAIDNPNETILILNNQDGVSALANKTFKSITYKDDAIEADSRMNVSDSLTLDNVTVEGPKGTSNGALLYTAPVVNINNSSVKSGSTVYNVFEQLSSGPELAEFNANHVIVDNTDLKHNVFNIYKVANDAVITIKNSYFNMDMNNSNALRLANYTNSTGVTVVFENVGWTYENAAYTPSSLDWAGLVIYQPASTDEALDGNLEKIKTWNFVFKNCTYNGVKVDSNNFGSNNQVIYLYNVGRTGQITDAAAELNVTFE